MDKKPFFTIGIPVYNTEKHVAECLDSILGQSFTDYEIICVNDGSNDSSLEILSCYAARNNNIKIIDRANSGVSAARNAVLYCAEGSYIYFIDSDDLMCPDCLQNAYSALSAAEFPDVLEAGYIIRTPQGDSLYKAACPGDKYFSPDLTKDERAVLMWLDTTYLPSVFARFVKTSFIRDNGISFVSRYYVAEDCDFVFTLHRKADTIIYGDFNSCIYFKTRENSLTAKVSPKSVYSNLCYYTDLFNDLRYFNLSENFIAQNRQKIEAKYDGFIHTSREVTLGMLEGELAREDAIEIARITQQFIGKDLKRLPLEFDAVAKIIFVLYKIFGIEKVVTKLYDKRRASGIITSK